jgi:pyridoxal phosphate enzyme (YggS family)
MTSIVNNVERVQSAIADAAARAGRSPSQITLVAVSKTHPAETVLEAVSAGLQHFGENRVEESESKIPTVLAQTDVPLTWHMIGHVQSRKAKDAAPLFQVIHSVDSLKLARKLAAALPEGKLLDVLLEMNVSGEASKEGMEASGWETKPSLCDQLIRDAGELVNVPGLNVCGLMTVAPIVSEPEDARSVFISLRGLRDLLAEALLHPLPHLSMGMTDDYAVAIEAGATMVRIGRAIFGERLR